MCYARVARAVAPLFVVAAPLLGGRVVAGSGADAGTAAGRAAVDDGCHAGDEAPGSLSLLQADRSARRSGRRAAGKAARGRGDLLALAGARVNKTGNMSLGDVETAFQDLDMNGRPCMICGPPIPERVDRQYVMRTDCGRQNLGEHPENAQKPLVSFSRGAGEGQNDTSAFCELNVQKICADSLYNKDFLYQAKSVDYPRSERFDPLYCYHNGWLAPRFRALQHNFAGMEVLAAEECNDPRRTRHGWNSTLSLDEMMPVYERGLQRGVPTEDEALFIGAWTCAMGSSGCDIAYCAYSFCDKGNGTFGMYEECDGWDPVRGMPEPTLSQ